MNDLTDLQRTLSILNGNDPLFKLNGYREITKIEYQKDKELKTVLLNFTEKTKLSSW